MAEQKTNGRRAVIVVVGIAFLASVTTLILALTASHGARQRDAAAIVADGADLHTSVESWRIQISRSEAASPAAHEVELDGLRKQAEAVSAWKPRTPCGLEARDRLRAAMDTRITSLLRHTPGTVQDELFVVDDALRTCSEHAGRDVEG